MNLPGEVQFVGQPESGITTVIDVRDHAERKLGGIRCHVTQVGRHNAYVDSPEEVLGSPRFQQETFVLAFSTVGRPEGVETDLFARLHG